MNFVGLFKRGDDLDKLQSEMETGMADVLLSELSTPPLQPEIDAHDEELEMPSASVPLEAAVEERSERRLTQYAQTKLAALTAFEEMFQGTRQELQLLGTTFAKVTSAHHMTREFLTTIHAEIHHANELELSNLQLQAENRKLTRQLEETGKILQQRESTVEALEHREAKLMGEVDSLRVALASAKSQAADANHAIVMLETERAELMTALASKRVTAEQLLRENEVMREKHVNLTLDLDNTLKKQTEAQRKFDELAAIHSRESAESAERLSKLAFSEKEVLRLQKQHDAQQTRVQELNDTIRALDSELDDAGKRHAAEAEALKKDLHTLNSKLQVSAKAQADASREIATLKLKLNDAISERRIAYEKLDALKAENERDKKQLSAASTSFSELNLLQTSEHVMLDLQKHEAEELRREVAALQASVKRLAPFERMHNAAKARQANASERPAGEAEQEPADEADADLESVTPEGARRTA